MRPTWTARTVVELYNLVVWNERNIELARELLGDTVIRHEVGAAHTLTHAEAVQRVVDMWEMADSLHFDLNVVVEGRWARVPAARSSRFVPRGGRRDTTAVAERSEWSVNPA